MKMRKSSGEARRSSTAAVAAAPLAVKICVPDTSSTDPGTADAPRPCTHIAGRSGWSGPPRYKTGLEPKARSTSAAVGA
eukprot:scaffold3964_cov126-Isochrysis_galbana.AAC.3